MTSAPGTDPASEQVVRSVAILGTGLIGTSVAMAASRTGCAVTGWDRDPDVTEAAAARSGLRPCAAVREAVEGADLVVVATPIPAVARTVVDALEAAPEAIVTDVASVKSTIVAEVAARTTSSSRFVPGHPMGGSERSGPEHASPSVVDGIVWVLAPDGSADEAVTGVVSAWVAAMGARPIVMTPERHDRLVAIVSHLPQVASSALMELAAIEEAGEPELLLLAAGGFRDLTRLAASDPRLWSDILVTNGEQVGQAIDLFIGRLAGLRAAIVGGVGGQVEEVFGRAKRARLQLAAKPTVRSGVAVWQVEIPDEPGALARLTAALADGEVNIEDLQIVHSPEGGRGTVHLTVALGVADLASHVLEGAGFDPIRLA
jgi:prephenate dehydrogenase